MGEVERKKQPVFVFAGDSITDCGRLFETEGLGNGYVRMIHDALPEAKILNRGYDGYIASRVWRVWDELCIRHQPDLVTLLVGVNDVCAYLCGGGYDARGFGEYVEKIILRTKEETAAKMILMEPFIFTRPAEYKNWVEPLSRFREKVRELSEKYNTGLVPLWDIFREAQKEWEIDALTVDGIHLTECGHRILARAWLEEYRLSEPRNR